jgi:hypothetical protein
MASERSGAWRDDPYRRHELRYWDGQAWTAHVSDVDVLAHDPVFPVPDGDGRAYLADPVTRRRPTRNPAAAWAIVGFVAVVGLAAVSGLVHPDGGHSGAAVTVQAAAADGISTPPTKPATPKARTAAEAHATKPARHPAAAKPTPPPTPPETGRHHLHHRQHHPWR